MPRPTLQRPLIPPPHPRQPPLSLTLASITVPLHNGFKRHMFAPSSHLRFPLSHHACRNPAQRQPRPLP